MMPFSPQIGWSGAGSRGPSVGETDLIGDATGLFILERGFATSSLPQFSSVSCFGGMGRPAVAFDGVVVSSLVDGGGDRLLVICFCFSVYCLDCLKG